LYIEFAYFLFFFLGTLCVDDAEIESVRLDVATQLLIVRSTISSLIFLDIVDLAVIRRIDTGMNSEVALFGGVAY